MNTYRNIVAHKQVVLQSDMGVRISKSTRSCMGVYVPSKHSLQRIQRLMNANITDADRPLVCFHDDGTFDVFRSFWIREKASQ